jgi:tripartite-type tricarboxylate transporter receptor subunit TctC
MEPEGIAIVASSPAELDQFVRAEEERWRKVVRENNIRAD